MAALSFGNVIADLAIAVFAVATWFCQSEERKLRILLRSHIKHSEELFASDIMIELRDSSDVTKVLGNYFTSDELARVSLKMHRLILYDNLTKVSLILFGIGISIEIVALVNSVLPLFSVFS